MAAGSAAPIAAIAAVRSVGAVTPHSMPDRFRRPYFGRSVMT
jgi:hypothetical protein